MNISSCLTLQVVYTILRGRATRIKHSCWKCLYLCNCLLLIHNTVSHKMLVPLNGLKGKMMYLPPNSWSFVFSAAMPRTPFSKLPWAMWVTEVCSLQEIWRSYNDWDGVENKIFVCQQDFSCSLGRDIWLGFGFVLLFRFFIIGRFGFFGVVFWCWLVGFNREIWSVVCLVLWFFFPQGDLGFFLFCGVVLFGCCFLWDLCISFSKSGIVILFQLASKKYRRW